MKKEIVIFDNEKWAEHVRRSSQKSGKSTVPPKKAKSLRIRLGRIKRRNGGK